MKFGRWLMLAVLLLLVVAAAVAFVATGAHSRMAARTARLAPAQTDLIDVSPLNQARSLAAWAISPEEHRLAQEAARLADHDVDLAFADGLREARLRPSDQDPRFRDLNARVSDAAAAVDSDKKQIAELKARLASAKADDRDSLNDQIALLEAQQAPDEDELDVAKQDLIRAGGDREGSIERQREEHEASEDHLAQTSSSSQPPTADLTSPNLAGQVRAWMWLKDKQASLDSALGKVLNARERLITLHDALQTDVNAGAAQRHETRQHAAGLRTQASRSAASKDAAAAAIKSFQRFADEQKLLAGYTKQLQDLRDLRDVYGDWIAITADQQRIVLHEIYRSLFWILLIVLLAYLAGLLVNSLFVGTTPEKKRLFTLRGVVRFALQAVAVLLIALVIFGAPNQTPTVLGLAGAGLTVALKDFIVGFFGWFVLMGRNGIRVGDWVEINGVVGEVIEIGLLRTVLLETGNWTDTGHPTGRKVAFVNSFAIEGHFFNFSTAGQWLWDELQILIPQGQDPYPLVQAVQKLVEDETRASAQRAEQEWQKSAGPRMQSLSVEPAIQLRPTLAGIELQIRYITSANERFAMRARMYDKIVGLLHGQAKTGT